ncbi:MAG: efflux RND transporter periplasmic adaptor subunit [Thermoguttaceae bacterium]
MRRLVILIASIGIAVAGLLAANLARNSGQYQIDWHLLPPAAREVQVAYPQRGEIVQTLVAPGRLKAIEEANVASQLIGRVVAIGTKNGKEIKRGDTVRKGDLLVKLDDTDARAKVDSVAARISRLEAAIRLAEAELKKADWDYKVAKDLDQKGATTASELTDRQTALKKAESSLAMWQHELAEAQAAVRAAKEELDRTEIRAPVDGVVVERDVEIGEIVIPGTTNLPGAVLMKIADLTRMEVEADVDETDVLLVRPGQPARVYLQADQSEPIRGVVERVAAKGTRIGDLVSFRTLISLPERAANLRAGMTATVEIEVRRAPDALGVPIQAVVHRRRKDLPDTPLFRQWSEREPRLPGETKRQSESRYLKIVFVVEADIVRARPVQTGLSDERRVEIVSGLTPDELVVVGPFRVLDELEDGQPVRVVEAEPASP